MIGNKTHASLLIAILLCSTIAGCIGSEDKENEPLAELVIAYEVKADYENIDENPQLLADYLEEALGVDVELYNVDSEGAIIEALRFGHADIAFMDGGAAWVGWKEYGLAAMAADQKSDERTYYLSLIHI